MRESDNLVVLRLVILAKENHIQMHKLYTWKDSMITYMDMSNAHSAIAHKLNEKKINLKLPQPELVSDVSLALRKSSVVLPSSEASLSSLWGSILSSHFDPNALVIKSVRAHF